MAPKYMDNGIKKVLKELNAYVKTFCIGEQGGSFPWHMTKASEYFNRRSAVSLRIKYNMLGYPENRLRDNVIRSIRNRKTPAVIGTGWLAHYPMAYAYAERSREKVVGCGRWQVCIRSTEYDRYFKINQGWGYGHRDGEWISAKTWFSGEISHNGQF